MFYFLALPLLPLYLGICFWLLWSWWRSRRGQGTVITSSAGPWETEVVWFTVLGSGSRLGHLYLVSFDATPHPCDQQPSPPQSLLWPGCPEGGPLGWRLFPFLRVTHGSFPFRAASLTPLEISEVLALRCVPGLWLKVRGKCFLSHKQCSLSGNPDPPSVTINLQVESG